MEAEVERLTALEALPEMMEGTKVAVTPAGSPVTPSVTGSLKPFVAAAITLNRAVEPAETEVPVGVALSIKSGTASTFKVNDVVRVTLPLAAETVSG